MPLGAVVAAILMAWISGRFYGEVGVRVVGAGFEILGAALVLLQIASVRRVLGLKGRDGYRALWQRMRSWLRRGRGNVIVQVDGSGGLHLGGSADVTTTRRPSSSATVDEKVDALWTAIATLHERISKSAERTGKTIADVRAEVSELATRARELAGEVEKLRKVAGGDRLDDIGAACIIAGLTLATFSTELYGWSL